ncbi:MAG TPA: tetratricopeptide repeat protein [Gemmataceae bacterium]|jgi:tetratricopeptide (TPR) repeat protein
MTPVAEPESRSDIERLARALAEAWRDGDRPLAESFLDRFPELWDQPDAALELIAEELALRADYDCPTSLTELARRFPQWAEPVRALWECQQLLGSQPLAPRFPVAGETLGEFHLLAELGRGAHGRVFLAEQESLADRRVALKLSAGTGTEHLSLARLQHTHIVPLYSAHDFPERGLRGLCMPYFGGIALAQLPSRLDGGRGLLAAIGEQAAGPARNFLAQASADEAICWIGAGLADALQYAHERGTLHLDLKPANVLLAADGVPMLLDFHLARPPLEAGSAPPAWLGGTPGYMAPEESFAVDAVREGRPIPRAVDGRADIYSLGVLLRELLNAMLGNNRVGPGLDAILNRCTEPLAAKRYATAADLAADFRRQLANLPLKGVSNRSLSERLAKWRRRRPLGLPLSLALGALLVAGAAFAWHSNRLAGRAREAERTGAAHLARRQFPEAIEAYRGGESLIEGLPFQTPLRTELRHGMQSAERGRIAADLHRFCEQARPFFDPDAIASERSRQARQKCRELWQRRDSLFAALAGLSDADLERQCRADLQDLAILAACSADHRSALTTLESAERLLGASAAIALERSRHARALGMEATADEAARQAQTLPARGPWDHLAMGRVDLAEGNVDRAAESFDRCLAIDPRNLWAHHYRGLCALKRKQPTEAIAAFSAACVMAPDAAWCRYNRGLAFAEAERFDLAEADFERTLALDPAMAAAHLGRSAIALRMARFPEALAALDSAAEGGIDPIEVLYRKALVHAAAGDRIAAIACLKQCLQQDPDHRPAKEELARLTGG